MSISWRIHIRESLHLAVPVAIGQLGHIMLGVVDSLMVGSLGAVPLAGASLGHSVFVLLLVFAAGVASAITPLTAIADGEGNAEEAGRVLRQGVQQNVLFGISMVGVAWAMAGYLHMLGQPQDVVREATPYLRMMGLTFVPMLLFMSVRNFIEGLSFTRPAMYIVLAANLVNVGGNWVFIHGKLGMPAMGLTGAGLSSFLVELFAAVAILIYLFRSRRFTAHLVFARTARFSADLQRRILRLGLPSGLQWLFEAGSFSFSALMMGWIGTTALAAHQIAINLAAISYMAILGISNAATIRVGNAFGRKDAANLRRAGYTAYLMAWTVMSLAAISFVFMRQQLPALYVSDEAVVTLAASLLVIAALFQLSDGTQAVGLGILRGMTDVNVPLGIAIVAYWLIGVPASYLLAFEAGLGPEGVWLGFVAGLSVAGASFIVRFRRQCERLAHRWSAAADGHQPLP
ncbi:MAG: MATE family efflux transporter [Bacteroidia bacterium]|nr:MATE family efflux transporter [Bacteroidia bacterium]